MHYGCLAQEHSKVEAIWFNTGFNKFYLFFFSIPFRFGFHYYLAIEIKSTQSFRSNGK
jgi:hypothetical protein